MNICGTGSGIQAAPVENNANEPCEKTKTSHTRKQEETTDITALSNLLPRLQGLIDAIEQPEDNIVEALGANLAHLQDMFVNELYSVTSAGSIDLSQKLTMRLDENGSLALMNEHPEKSRINALLDERPELSATFREISTLSALLKDINSIGKIIGGQRGTASYQNTPGQPHDSGYHFSLKGEMSHFYFA